MRHITSQYEKSVLQNSSVVMAYLDDESINLKNRLSIIATNGLLGFGLILLTLCVFLNIRSGFWVAMGIPFSLCFTLIVGYFLGYTINGVTLAGIIIVLGIVVDDAIIVAENISRKLADGIPPKTAAKDGVMEVIFPILASVLTTCAAFLPLFFFTGRFGSFVKFIPPMIFLMLLASLIESFFLLPSHMTWLKTASQSRTSPKQWFMKWETLYESLLTRLLARRYWIIMIACILMVGTVYIINTTFKFVLFPAEESREIVLSGYAKNATTAKKNSH